MSHKWKNNTAIAWLDSSIYYLGKQLKCTINYYRDMCVENQ